MPKATKGKNQSTLLGWKSPYQYLSPAHGAIVAVLALLALIYLVYYSTLGIYSNVLVGIAVMIVAGDLIGRIKSSTRLTFGTYMLRTHIGLEMMDRLSKRAQWFWNGLADWGMVLGFGLYSHILFKGDISRRMLAFGIISLLVICVYVLPYEGIGLSFINIPQLQQLVQGYTPTPDYTNYALFVSAVLGGFILFLVLGLVEYAANSLVTIAYVAGTVLSHSPNYQPLYSIIPGVAPIIPGITIPLFPGILALGFVLIVHEYAHGILSRIAKVKVVSSGLLLLGIIPIGAFVEPVEKEINKLSNQKQNRISAAGVASNLLWAVVSFVPLFLMYVYVMPHYSQNYYYIQAESTNGSAYHVIPPGSQLLKWNGYNVSNQSVLSYMRQYDTAHPDANVSILTNNGTYEVRTNNTGLIGISIGSEIGITGGLAGQVANFIYTFLGLAFLLNFFIAIVNYIPIPGFDGWRIFSLNIKRRKYVFWFTTIILAALFVNVLPYSWYLPLLGVPAVIVSIILIAALLKWMWGWVNETGARPKKNTKKSKK